MAKSDSLTRAASYENTHCTQLYGNDNVMAGGAGAHQEHHVRPATASDYYSQDFQWEDLRDEVERLKGLESSPSTLQDFAQSNTIEAWKTFHELHAKHVFFKERRYLVKEFPDLLASDRAELKVLEIGCGTGSSVLPVLRANNKAIVYACDCSESALKRAQDLVQNIIPLHGKCRFFPFHCDISSQMLPAWLHCSSCTSLEDKSDEGKQEELLSSTKSDISFLTKEEQGSPVSPHEPTKLNVEKPFCCIGGVDIIMMIFTLSSLPPLSMRHVIKECFSVLKPGGLLLFRDYGLYDMTMQRFSPAQRVGERLYQRGDGTLSYFFTPEVLRDLFTKEGFLEEEISFCCVELKNHRKDLPMKRVWVHAKFSKPVAS